MKITVLSDIHFGHALGKEQETDPYDAVKEIASRTPDTDLYIIPGDIFDMKIPSPETLSKSMEALSCFLSKDQLRHFNNKDGVTVGMGLLPQMPIINPKQRSLEDIAGKYVPDMRDGVRIADSINNKALNGKKTTSIIAIHGTHERRAKGLVNPVEILEKAGFLMHLNQNGLVLERKGERVAVHGLSGVPDQYTKKELADWNPKPVPNCFNIFMLHQNMTEFMPSQVEHTLDIDELPKGFDMYLNGHIHSAQETRAHGKPLIICGSLVTTQVTSGSNNGVGYWEIDTSSQPPKIEFVLLEGQRKIIRMDLQSPSTEDVSIRIEQAIKEKSEKKPVIRINIKGESEIDARTLRKKYEDRAIISIKRDLRKAIIPRNIEDHKLSVSETGAKLLEANLKEAGLDPRLYEQAFELLLEGRSEDALKLLREKTKSDSKT